MMQQVLLETPAWLMRSLRQALPDLGKLSARTSRRQPLLTSDVVIPEALAACVNIVVTLSAKLAKEEGGTGPACRKTYPGSTDEGGRTLPAYTELAVGACSTPGIGQGDASENIKFGMTGAAPVGSY